jgi:HD superfamily phosphohydrolase
MARSDTKIRVIRDPVYGYIEVSANLAQFVDHPLFQRLRRVGQTSMTSMVYPASTGSRFEHSLGAMHLARRAWRAIWRKARGDEELERRFIEAVHRDVPLPATGFDLIIEDAVGAVALLHDLGHPPFSHVLEPAFDRLARRWVQDDRRERWIASGGAFHEFAGMILLDQMLADLAASVSSELRQLVKLIYEAKPSDGGWKGALHSIVAGEIDVDRLDYLMRDAQKAGTEFGAIDYERLVDSLELRVSQAGDLRIAPSVTARSAVETLLVQRTQSYRWITYHARVVGANLALRRAFSLLLDFAEDGRPVGLAGAGEVSLAQFFKPLLPPLNFLAPGPQELAILRGAVEGWELDETAETQALRGGGLAGKLQGAVDDPAVLSAMERAALLCSLLLASAEPKPDIRAELRRYVAYAESIFARRKNVVSAWKTVDDLERVALGEPFKGRLEATIDDVYGSTIEELNMAGELPDLRRRALERERDLHKRRLEEQPIAELNDIFSALLVDGDPNQARVCELLREAATPSFGPESGFWDLSFARLRAVEDREEKLSVLFHHESERELVQTSPIVRSLTDVADARIRLFVFFFVTESDLGRWNDSHVGLAREGLIATFLPTFLEFLREAWPKYLKAARTPRVQ